MYEPKNGDTIKTTLLGTTIGMTIHPKHLNCRKEGILGTVKDYVPGHGGDVWFVQHDNSVDIGAYCFNEMEHVRRA